MKMQYKATFLMIIVGVISLFLITILYVNLIKKTVLHEELQNIANIAKEVADQMDSHLESKSDITKSLSSAPIITNTLRQSNILYGAFSEGERNTKIELLNKQWLDTIDINDPFVQNHLTNPVAEFLKFQQTILPGLYGEIFLTNKYGVMIASTGKLTTLAHAKKYWWEASYNDGEGKVFFDDRGFDESVKGYVLGVVVPIKNGEDIIGILKSNINIEGLLSDTIHNFRLNHPGNIQIARTKGLILAEEGESPLSNNLPGNITQLIKAQEEGAEFIQLNNRNRLVAFYPIPLTLGSDEFGFGGKYKSIDHINGNEGEGWHIIITLDEEIALLDANRTTLLLTIAGIIYIIISSLIALILGKWFANPLINISETAQKIGNGNLDTRIVVKTKDEIGNLALSINMMAINLAKALSSRDKLIKEVTKREKEITIQLKEKKLILKETHHRIKNNLVTITALLTLHSKSVTNAEAISALQDAANRVKSMAILYEKLLLKDVYHTTSTKEYLNSLVKEIISLFPLGLSLKVGKQISDFQLDPKILIPLGIIINELFTNIMKYAFPDRDSGLIEVTLTKDQGNINLIIKDNGIGLPEGFDLEKQNGFGLMLIKMLTQQFEGSFTMENHFGTKSIIKLRIE
jgi:two-component sensor histidine kinase/HAMP domain-containing protein